MFDNFHKKLLANKPVDVPTHVFNHHLVIASICYFVIAFLLASAGFFYWLDEKHLISVNAIDCIAWLIILKYNLRYHGPCIALLCFSVLISNIFYIYTFGWEAGFQYYFLSIAMLILFHAFLPVKYLLSTSVLFVAIYLILYTQDISVIEYQDSLIVRYIYIFNSISAYLLVLITILFFRADIKKILGRLSNSASTDQLTQLLNRHSMLQELQKVTAMSDRYQHHHSLLLIDIDHFKQANDTLGHAAGDAILKQFAAILKQRLRDTDSICRWGGEEFLILMPFTDISNASRVAEQLRLLVAENEFQLGARQAFITISGGLVELSPNESVNDALSRADKLLYEGKNSGRNKIVSESKIDIAVSGQFKPQFDR